MAGGTRGEGDAASATRAGRRAARCVPIMGMATREVVLEGEARAREGGDARSSETTLN